MIKLLVPVTIFSWFAFFLSGVAAMYVFMGQPPRHCRYMVPIAGHAHVYGCSQHPLPRKP